MRRFGLFLCCLLGFLVSAASCQAEGECQSSEPATYKAMPGDTANSTGLQAERTLSTALHRLQINVCSGDLRVRRAPGGDHLRLLIASPGADRSLQEFVRSFSVEGGTALVAVQVPPKYHATVTLLVPQMAAPAVEINLGKGNLLVNPEVLGDGDRELNVGAGGAKLSLDSSRSYASLEINIGLGELKDRLPGGRNAHFVVSRETSGTGKGSLELNVGAGTVELTPVEE